MEIPDSARDVIESGQLAHFATINRDGTPQITAVWVGLDGDDIVIGKLSVDQKVRNMRRDPRVSLSIEAPTGATEIGLKHHLIIEGTAEIEEGGAPALLQELARRYIAPDAKFPPMPDPPPGFIIRVTPTRIRGAGPWVGVR